MAKYVTAQKTQLLSFMEKHRETSMTAREIYTGMKNDASFSTLLAKSTLYRLLDTLAEENILIKDVKKGTRQYVFRYAGQPECGNHLHMTCLDCGGLVHIDEERTKEIHDCLVKSDLDLDEHFTMLFGHCGKCKEDKHS